MSRRIPRGVRRTGVLARLGRDRRGVSAVEFALLAPVIIALYFGLAEFSQGFMAKKRMTHAASAIGDLVSQTPELNKSNLRDIFSIGGLIMQPFSPDTLTSRVTAVTMDANGVASVDWSLGSTMNARGDVTEVPGLTPDDTVVIPADMILAGESLIISETTYEYASVVRYVLPDVTTFASTFYLRPRRAEQVVCTDCPG